MAQTCPHSLLLFEAASSFSFLFLIPYQLCCEEEHRRKKKVPLTARGIGEPIKHFSSIVDIIDFLSKEIATPSSQLPSLAKSTFNFSNAIVVDTGI